MTLQNVKDCKKLNKAHKVLLKYLQSFHMPMTPKVMTENDKMLEMIYLRIDAGKKQMFKPTLEEAIQSALSIYNFK